MLGIIPKLRRMLLDPQLFALVLESRKGAVLHLGIHYSLDEAIRAATPGLLRMAPHKPEDKVGVELWTSLSGEAVINGLLSAEGLKEITIPVANDSKGKSEEKPLSPTARIKAIRDHKNNLMKELIETGDAEAVKSTGGILSKHEQALILEKIAGKEKEKTHVSTQ